MHARNAKEQDGYLAAAADPAVVCLECLRPALGPTALVYAAALRTRSTPPLSLCPLCTSPFCMRPPSLPRGTAGLFGEGDSCEGWQTS